MAEQGKNEEPGSGVDRTLIRRQLALSVPERLKVLIEAARALERIRARKQP